jgi:hypothetical protein
MKLTLVCDGREVACRTALTAPDPGALLRVGGRSFLVDSVSALGDRATVRLRPFAPFSDALEPRRPALREVIGDSGNHTPVKETTLG